MKLLLESRCSIGSPFNLNTIHIDVHVHVVLEIKCPLFQCSEITQRGDFSKFKYLAESCTKRTPPRNITCLIKPSCVVDLVCILIVIQQFVKIQQQ